MVNGRWKNAIFRGIFHLPFSIFHFTPFGAAAALFVLAAWAAAQAATAPPPRGGLGAASAVVLVSLDGFPASALDDPQLPAPTLRALIAAGASARRMTGVNPAVTWPTHTTFVTGVLPSQHGVLFNGMLMRAPSALPKVEPWRDKPEMVRAKTVYDAAHEAGLTTAQVDWVAIHNPGTITWAFEERPEPAGAIVRELIAAGHTTPEQIAGFRGLNVVTKDQMWTTAAVHIIERHQPNLLMLHLLALDSTHHRYGPGTPAANAAIGFLDSQLARVVEAVRRSPMAERTTIMVVSDHGFKTAAHTVRPNAMLRRAGLLAADAAGKITGGDAFVISEGGTALVYALGADRRALVTRLALLFRGAPGIARVVEPSGYAALGYPAPDQNSQMGDLVLVAADNHSFSGEADGAEVVDNPQPRGFHGALSSDPEMDSIFVASGQGIRAGVRLDRVSATQVGPTIAALLDLKLPAATGTPVHQILGQNPSPAATATSGTSLFNGRDLSGWKVPQGDNGHWRVVDGVIDYDAASEAPGDKHLWSEHDYGDFELTLEWRLKSTPYVNPNVPVIRMDGSHKKNVEGRDIRIPVPDSDSGLYLRGSDKAQVNIWSWPIGSGEVWGYRTDASMPAAVRAGATPRRNADRDIGAWNEFRITMRGSRLTVVLNGETVIDDAELPGVPSRGPIALQHHGAQKNGEWTSPPSLVQFRNISIRELPPGRQP